MIKLSYTFNREPIYFLVEDKKIVYYDRKWPGGIQFMPKNENLTKTLMLNQRRFPLAQHIVSWINDANSGTNLTEYQACTTDEEVANKVREDAKKKGLLEFAASPTVAEQIIEKVETTKILVPEDKKEIGEIKG